VDSPAPEALTQQLDTTLHHQWASLLAAKQGPGLSFVAKTKGMCKMSLPAFFLILLSFPFGNTSQPFRRHSRSDR
jgi:hypothetical protein